MHFSHWEPPGVCERRWSANLKVSISNENRMLGGCSGRPSKEVECVITGTGVPCEQLVLIWEHLGPSTKQCENPQLPLRNAWVLVEFHSEVCRYYLRFSRCTWGIEYPLHMMRGVLFITNFYILIYYPASDSTFCCIHRYITEPKNIGSDLNMNAGNTRTETWLSDRMTSIDHHLNAIHYTSHLIRADKSRNTQFINIGRKLETSLVLSNNLGLANWWNLIPISFCSICGS